MEDVAPLSTRTQCALRRHAALPTPIPCVNKEVHHAQCCWTRHALIKAAKFLADKCKGSHTQPASAPAIQREVNVQWKTIRPASHGLSNRQKRTHLPTPCAFADFAKLLLEDVPGSAKQPQPRDAPVLPAGPPARAAT